MNAGVAVTQNVISAVSGDNPLTLQSSDPSRSINLTKANTFTLPEDGKAVQEALDSSTSKVTASRIDVFQTALTNQTDKLDLVDVAGASIAEDTDRFYPERPGTARGQWFPTLIPNAPSFFGNGQNVFYKKDTDRVALLSVVQDEPNDGGSIFKSYRTVYQSNRFLLQSVQENRSERAQIVETFGGSQLFLYGSSAEIYQFQGILLNTASFPWKAEFIRAYETYLKGSVAREKNLRVYIAYDDVLREGYILNANFNYAVGALRHIIFSFSMFITNKRIFSFGDSRAVGTREQLNTTALRNSQSSQAEEDNALGVPLVFGSDIDEATRYTLRAKINKAAKDNKRLPFYFATVTGKRKTSEDFV